MKPIKLLLLAALGLALASTVRAAMKLPRRTFLHLAAGAAALPAVSRIAIAQTYVRIV